MISRTNHQSATATVSPWAHAPCVRTPRRKCSLGAWCDTDQVYSQNKTLGPAQVWPGASYSSGSYFILYIFFFFWMGSVGPTLQDHSFCAGKRGIWHIFPPKFVFFFFFLLLFLSFLSYLFYQLVLLHAKNVLIDFGFIPSAITRFLLGYHEDTWVYSNCIFLIFFKQIGHYI